MEEEIITPEEDTFGYDKLRYILTNDGYVCHASIGGFIVCDLGECTEYNGDIPDGYETIEEWYEEENERLNSWKIVDGNLAFDPNKYEILQARCEKEHQDNRYVCHKEISNLTNLVKSDNADSYLKSTSILSNFIEVNDSNKFASTYIELFTNETIANKLHIKFNNGNLLTNSATSKMDSGISFEVNADRTINIKGTATNDIEYDIGGYPNNTKPILAFKKGINYYLSSNGYQIKMYNFDGVDREEIYSGTGGVINFTDDDRKVTQIVLFIPNETEINETLKPMLNVGTTAKEYITYEGNDAVVYLGENTFTTKDTITIEDGTPILKGVQYPSSYIQGITGLKPSETLTPSATLKPSNEVKEVAALYPSDTTYPGYVKNEYLDDTNMPITYLDLTYMYCMENIKLKVIYPNTQRNNDLTGYETPNGGFAIDEEGNMYCNNANIKGSTIVNGGNFSVDSNGNMICNNANIKGSAIVNGSKFSVDAAGNMTCNNATMNSATMNNATINNTAIVNGSNFNVDKNGNLTCNNANITGGNITLSDTGNPDAIPKMKVSGSTDPNTYSSVGSKHIDLVDNTKDVSIMLRTTLGTPRIIVENHSQGTTVSTTITPNNVTTPTLVQTSREETKKNFELFEDALSELLKIDIYKYNLKTEEDTHKKHLGFVIGDKYNYSHLITAEYEGEEIGVDNYSMTSLCLQAIKEQQKQIEELTKELNKLKESDTNGEN